ncbi:unnamed protein product [Sympodiomycopsis kandeliae]
MDDLDIWSSPDPSANSPPLKPATSSSSKTESKEKSRGLFDDDAALDAGWGKEEDTTAGVREEVSERNSQTAEAQPSGTETGQEESKSEDRKGDDHVQDDDDSDNDADAFQEAEEEESVEQLQHEDIPPSLEQEPEKAHDDDGDGFGDFDDDDLQAGPSTAPQGQNDDDDFGDFDDFPQDDMNGMTIDDDDGFGDEDFGDVAIQAPSSSTIPEPIQSEPQWPLLDLSDTSFSALSSQIATILSPPTVPNGPSEPFGSGWTGQLSQDQIRQVDGIAQILPVESSRQIHSILSTRPPLKPTDWLRSRTRRDMYISLGVPINLDELMETSSSSSSSSTSRLPPLNIKLEDDHRRGGPNSAPAQDSSLRSGSTSSGTRSASSNGAGAEANGEREKSKERERERAMEKRRENLGLSRPPDVDFKRVEEVCNLTEDQLTLLPLPSLEALQRELTSLTTQTSTLLTHHLTLRESLQSDSETYHGLIADLVAGAASRIGGNGKAERSNTLKMKEKRSTFGGSSSNSLRRFATPPPSSNTATSTPRSQSPAPSASASSGWRR